MNPSETVKKLVCTCYTDFEKVFQLVCDHPGQIPVDELIEVTMGTNTRKTPLLHLFIGEHYESLLLNGKKPINVNILDSNQSSPLDQACAAIFKKEVLLLLKYGADVNLKDARGISPLIRLCMNPWSLDSVSVASLLLENGADPNGEFEDHQGKKNSILCLFESISESDGGYGQYSTIAYSLVKILLNADANPNYVNECGENALHLACKYDDWENIEILIRGGCNYNLKDNRGNVPTDYLTDPAIDNWGKVPTDYLVGPTLVERVFSLIDSIQCR